MFLILGALGDPLLEDVFLLLRELTRRVRRWHDLVRIARYDASPQEALVGLIWNDSRSGFPLGGCEFEKIQTQIRLAVIGVLTVTAQAGSRKNRPNVAVERHLFVRFQVPC